MKAVILAGGFGTRLSEETTLKPKPMVEIANKPIIWHLMKFFSHYGVNDFVICAGYKSEYIKNYFANFFLSNSDIQVNLNQNTVRILNKQKEDWKIDIIDTGKNTMTGGRLKRVEQYIGDDDFYFTYGDGLSDVDLNKLLKFHKSNKSIATLTAVKTPERFGKLSINNETNIVESFKEKPQNLNEWINGGFFVLSKKVFNFIEDDETIFEKHTLEKISEKGMLSAFKHEGFWYAMDKLSDKKYLEERWNTNKAPWKVWE
jgi:glucose-1-phosphate cytidylyltransferase